MFESLESRLHLSTGGGFTNAGLEGAYFNNTTLTGTPSVIRKDVRIDFDWGTTVAPGGSSSLGFSDIGTDNYSARWTGQVVARFNETYTFKTSSDEGVRLYIKPTSSGTWTTLIDNWTAHTITDNTAPYAMTAGQTYDIKVEYYENTGAATIKLKWSSPSTPEEVIDPAVQAGINAGTTVDYDPSVMFADAMKMARIGQYTALSPGATYDANGNPTGDIQFILFHGQGSDVTGKYTMTFNGQATIGYAWANYTANSQTYDSVSNTTTAVFTINTQSPLQFSFTNTKRLATDTTPTGMTNIKIMRPVSPGATTSFAPNVLFTPAYETLLSKFTAIRFMDYFATNSAAGQVGGNSVVNWVDRTKPWYSSQQGVGGGYQGVGGALEYAVALCNETGKDLWLNVPMQASDSYLNNLALAVKYGTDANGNPYTAAQANPVYAPLNPNLKVYLEYSNEIWNGMFYQASLASTMAQTEITNNTTNGQILKYDNNTNAWVLGQRWWILRTKEISDAFRMVWGDAAMMSSVRPVFQFQYNNYNSTAANALQFLDNYFNNADGNHVITPHPVNYYLYGAGGGWYNGVNDPSGLGGVNVGNAGFEIPTLGASNSQANPVGSSWTFTGTAGIASNNMNRAAAVISTTLGTLATPTSTLGAGYSFTVGAQDIYVNELGRYVVGGNTNGHGVYLLDATHTQLVTTTVYTAGKPAGQYAYGNIGSVRLLAGQTYYIVSVEDVYSWNPTRDTYYDQGSSQTTYAGITINNAMTINMPNMEWSPTTWVWNVGLAGHVAGPVDFRYTTAANTGPVSYPPDTIDGSQAAYIQGSGSMSQTLTFPAGVSGITFNAAQGATGSESFNVYIDGVQLIRDWRMEFNPSSTNFSFYRTGNALNLTAGAHTLSFQGAGTGTAFIDTVKVESVDQMLASGVADISAIVRGEVNWAQAYGLRTVGYEGGFMIGGDQPTAVAYAANVDPRTKQGVIDTMNQYLSSGGDLPIVFNASGGAYAVTMTSPYGLPDVNYQNTPKMQGYNQVLAGMPAATTNGTVVPRILNSSNVALAYANNYDGLLYADTALNLYRQGGWVSWSANVPVNGTYTLTTSATGTGGSYVVEVDGQTLVTGIAGTDAAGQITLTPGLHSVKIRSTSVAAFQVSQVVFSQNGAPAAPAITSAVYANAQASLIWSAVTGATGYMVAYGNSSGSYTNFVDTGPNIATMLTGLDNTKVYYVVVYAYDSSGRRSLLSNEIRTAQHSTDPMSTANFEGYTGPVATPLVEPFVDGNYSFTSVGNTGGNALLMLDPTTQWYVTPSKALSGRYWGSGIVVARADGHPFDLNSIDLAAWAGGQSARITITDPSGATSSQILNGFIANANNTVSSFITFNLNLLKVQKIQVDFFANADGSGRQYTGVLDNIVTDVLAPAPTALGAVATSTSQINLSWTAPAGTIIGYNIYRGTIASGESLIPLNGGTLLTTTTYSDTTVSAGTTYYYTVVAVTSAGSSPASAEANALTFPAAPTGLSARFSTGTVTTSQSFAGTAATNWGWDTKADPNTQLSGTNQMTYTNAATNGSSYVTKSITDAATVFSNGTGTISMHFTVDLSNYRNAMTYTWGPTIAELQMNVGNGSGFIPWTTGKGAIANIDLIGGWQTSGMFGIYSNAIGAYGSASGGSSTLVAIPVNAVFDFTWTVSVAGSAATAWTVTSSVSAYNSTIGTITVPTSTYTDTLYSSYWSGLGSATAYALGDSGYNNGVAPTVGQSITFSSFSASVPTLTWTAPSGTVSGYNVYRGTISGGESLTPLNGATLITTTTFNDTTASAGTTYYYTVKAVNSSGSSIASTEANALTFPAAPTGLVGTSVSASQINLGWAAPSGTVSGYNVYRGTTSGGESITPLNGATLITTTTFNDTTASAGTTYYYTVKAVNSSGSSIASTEANALTFPNTPTGLTATPISASQINLGWAAPSGTVSGYNVYRGTTSGGESLTPLNGATLITTATYNDITAIAGVAYFYTVVTVNSSGSSTASIEANAITTAPLANIFTTNADIGAPGATGSSSFAAGTYTVRGAGTDIAGTSDKFQYDYQNITGNGTIIARVVTVQNTNASAKGGVMFRNGTTANAMFVAVEMTPSSGVILQWRTTAGGTASSTTVTGRTPPHWVKLVRSANSFSGYYSADGITWTQIGTTKTVAMASAATVGLSVTSRVNATLCTSTFDNVSIAGVAAKLTGTAIGTAGSRNNSGNDITKVFDGNLTTYFDAPTASGAWVGLNLGSMKLVSQIKFAPRTSYESLMLGGKFQVSNTADFSSGVVDLAIINTTPASGVLTTINVAPNGAYRYLRYLGPDNSWCNLAELEVWG